MEILNSSWGATLYEAKDLSVFQNSRFPPAKVQRVHDAAARLRSERGRVADSIARGVPADARIVGRGAADINRWMLAESHRWHHLLSARVDARIEQLRVSLPNNDAVVAGGLDMISLWDFERAEPEARLLLAGQDPRTYYFAFVPAQMKIIDRREVLLDGPIVHEEVTVMRVWDTGCMRAAMEYWRTIMATAYPCAAEKSGISDLSPRQQQIVRFLAVPLADEQIAERLGVSVRTVRYDVASILNALDAPNRFVAGLRLRERMGLVRLPDSGSGVGTKAGHSPASGHGSGPHP